MMTAVRKRRKVRPRVTDLRRLRSLAREGKRLDEAADVLGLSPAELNRRLTASKRGRETWDRGRLLYNVWRVSMTGANYEEAAQNLGMEPAAFEKLVADDPEIGDTWVRARVATLQVIHSALINAARGGSVSAINRAIEHLTRDVKRPVNLHALTMQQLVDVFRVTRQSVHAWARKGCPRNRDGTFPLGDLIEWRVRDLLSRTKVEDGSVDDERRVKKARAGLLELRLQRERGEVLPRDSVIIGLIGRLQSVRTATAGRALELAARLRGMPAPKIAPVLEEVFADILNRAAVVPDAVVESLPAELARELERFFKRLWRQPDDD